MSQFAGSAASFLISSISASEYPRCLPWIRCPKIKSWVLNKVNSAGRVGVSIFCDPPTTHYIRFLYRERIVQRMPVLRKGVFVLKVVARKYVSMGGVTTSMISRYARSRILLKKKLENEMKVNYRSSASCFKTDYFYFVAASFRRPRRCVSKSSTAWENKITFNPPVIPPVTLYSRQS